MDFAIIQVTDDNKIRLSSGETTSRITGMQALIQQVLIELLSDPIPDRSRGAGLILAVNTIAPTESANINSVFPQIISVTQAHIIANQQLAPNLTAEERLVRLEYISGTYDRIEWTLDFRIINVAGDTVEVNLPTALTGLGL